MDFSNFLTLIFFFYSAAGSANIYKGKTGEDSGLIVKGILELCMSVFGVAFLNPIFDNFFLSLVSGLLFSMLFIGYVAGVFLNTKPEEEILYVKGEWEHANDQQQPQLKESEEIQHHVSKMPTVWSNIRTAIDFVRANKGVQKY